MSLCQSTCVCVCVSVCLCLCYFSPRSLLNWLLTTPFQWLFVFICLSDQCLCLSACLGVCLSFCLSDIVVLSVLSSRTNWPASAHRPRLPTNCRPPPLTPYPSIPGHRAERFISQKRYRVWERLNQAISVCSPIVWLAIVRSNAAERPLVGAHPELYFPIRRHPTSLPASCPSLPTTPTSS